MYSHDNIGNDANAAKLFDNRSYCLYDLVHFLFIAYDHDVAIF